MCSKGSRAARTVVLFAMWVVVVAASAGVARPRAPGAPAVADTTSYGREAWSASSDTLRVGRPGARLDLSHPFIVPGSETVTVGGSRLGPGDYRIDYLLGTLRIDAPVPAKAVVVVTYRRQPFLFDPVASLRPLAVAPRGGREAPATRVAGPEPQESAPGTNLVFGGSKSVSFTVGSNRGTKLDQTLQATIEGDLTPTIHVRALLSDNNLPIQPEGNTAELQYLDKVFVEIEGSQAKATLGDFGFSNTISTFSPFTRQLKGIATEAWASPGHITLAGATSKGVFRTVKFRGTTGLQGPYDLLSAGRTTGEVIIAGTEQVTMDGVELTRGQNHDYVIDYDQGNITFTPRRLVTKDTEISVDFEVTQEKYDRTALFAAGQTAPLPGGMEMQFVVARERDDPSRPRNQTLTPAEKAVLRDAGDNPEKAVTGGIAVTDVGKGDYVQVPADSTGPQRFVFNDSLGNYNVSFVEVENGRGDYSLGGISQKGRPYYKWVGAGNGNYLVGKQLPLPESLSLVTARLRREKGEHVVVDAEWNVSRHDRNLFSPLDDGDNVGDAGRLSLGLRKLPAGPVALGVTGSVSTLEDRFTSFDKPRSSYFYRDWNLENTPLVGREVISELETTADSKRTHLRYALGRLDRDNFNGTKNEGEVRLGAPEDRGLDLRAFTSDARGSGQDRTRRHATARAALGAWGILPSATFSTERYLENRTATPDSGIAFNLVGLGLAKRHPGATAASISVEQRDTREVDPATDAWRDSRRDRTATASVAHNGGGWVTGELLVTHRVEDDRIARATSTTDLARVKGTLRARDLGMRHDLDYEISQDQSRVLERNVILVGEGQGDYNAQGELVGKGKGNYALVFSPTTQTRPSHRVDMGWRLQWRRPLGAAGRAGGGWLDWVRANVSLDQTVRVVEETSHEPAWQVYAMLPSALQRNGETVYGKTSVRQDWSLLGDDDNTSLTVRYQREDEEDNRFQGVNEERFFGEHAVRVSRSLSQLVTLNAEASRTVRRRGGEGLPVGTGSRYDVRALAGVGGLGLRFTAGSTVDADVELTRQRDQESLAEQVLLSVRPRLVWRITDQINVYASYELTRVWDRAETTVRPVIFARAGDAHHWSITPNLRLSHNISVVAAYQGRIETTFTGQRITEHQLRLETRAFF